VNEVTRSLLDKDTKAILAFAESNMRLTVAAGMLGIDYRTLDTRLNYIYKRSKLNPKKFRDLVELVRLVDERTDE